MQLYESELHATGHWSQQVFESAEFEKQSGYLACSKPNGKQQEEYMYVLSKVNKRQLSYDIRYG